MNTPKYALSIRQPWAWLIVHGYKDIENRNWQTSQRGLIYIHAGKGMTRDEYEDCREFALGINPTILFPAFDDLPRGGIVGTATLTGCVVQSESPWFVGSYGFTLADAKPLRFTPLAGALGFFRAALPSEN